MLSCAAKGSTAGNRFTGIRYDPQNSAATVAPNQPTPGCAIPTGAIELAASVAAIHPVTSKSHHLPVSSPNPEMMAQARHRPSAVFPKNTLCPQGSRKVAEKPKNSPKKGGRVDFAQLTHNLPNQIHIHCSIEPTDGTSAQLKGSPASLMASDC
jgi:hypothetical protein